MIEQYNFGSIIISGKCYTSDLKSINGKVNPDWWRKSGHTIEVEDSTDILKAKPDSLVIGSGKPGMMKLSKHVKQHLADSGIHVFEQPTSMAMQMFNWMVAKERIVWTGGTYFIGTHFLAFA